MNEKDLPVVFVETVEHAGHTGMGGYPNLAAYQLHEKKPFFFDLENGWTYAINASDKPAKSGPPDGMAGDVPAYSVGIWWNGWLAGFIDAGGGLFAAGEAANEKTYLAALRKGQG